MRIVWIFLEYVEIRILFLNAPTACKKKSHNFGLSANDALDNAMNTSFGSSQMRLHSVVLDAVDYIVVILLALVFARKPHLRLYVVRFTIIAHSVCAFVK